MNRKLVDNHRMYKCTKFQMDQLQDRRLAAIFLLNLAKWARDPWSPSCMLKMYAECV